MKTQRTQALKSYLTESDKKTLDDIQNEDLEILIGVLKTAAALGAIGILFFGLVNAAAFMEMYHAGF